MLSEIEVRLYRCLTERGEIDFFLYNSRRLKEAKETYEKVLEIEARHPLAHGFLGITYHLMGEVDKAIVKYHEVRDLLLATWR